MCYRYLLKQGRPGGEVRSLRVWKGWELARCVENKRACWSLEARFAKDDFGRVVHGNLGLHAKSFCTFVGISLALASQCPRATLHHETSRNKRRRFQDVENPVRLEAKVFV